MKVKDLDNQIWKLEGKKIKVTIAQVRELRKIIDLLICNDPFVYARYAKFFKEGSKKSQLAKDLIKRKKK